MEALWQATESVAYVLSESPVIARYRSVLSGEATQQGSKLPELLREIFAGFGNLEAQPFLLSLRLGRIPTADMLADDPGAPSFHSDAKAVTTAGLGLIEWLRSRMPRYPIRFKLPHTDPFSTRVVDEGFPDSHWPWLLELRRAGFQAQPSVAAPLAKELEIPEAPVREALVELRASLQASPPWQRYVAAANAVDAEAEAMLGELRDSYRHDARNEAVDIVEPHLLMRRLQHRHAVLHGVERDAESRGGKVAEYYRAFRLVDYTLAGVSALLGQLLFYGKPQELRFARASWRRDVDDRLEVELHVDDIWLRLNEVVRVPAEVPELGGLAVIEGINLSFRRHGDDFVGGVRAFGPLL